MGNVPRNQVRPSQVTRYYAVVDNDKGKIDVYYLGGGNGGYRWRFCGEWRDREAFGEWTDHICEKYGDEIVTYDDFKPDEFSTWSLTDEAIYGAIDE